LSAFSQVNPGKLDSLSHAIDSSNKAIEQWQDSFTKRQDSIYRAGVQGSKIGKGIHEETNEEKHEQQTIIVIILAVAAVVFAAVWLRKRRTED
jgi:hypothetical protein